MKQNLTKLEEYYDLELKIKGLQKKYSKNKIAIGEIEKFIQENSEKIKNEKIKGLFVENNEGQGKNKKLSIFELFDKLKLEKSDIVEFVKIMYVFFKGKIDISNLQKDLEDYIDYKKDIEKYEKDRSLQALLEKFKTITRGQLLNTLGKSKPPTEEDLWAEFDKTGQEKEPSIFDKEVKKISDMMIHFHIVYKFFRKYGYAPSYKELIMMEDIVEDLKKGRLVTLLGETGSGKTELARFLSKEFFGKDAIVVSGNRYLTDEDFTIEKIITSKSLLDKDEITNKKSGLTKEEEIKNLAKDFFDKIVKSQEFKKELENIAKKEGKTLEEIEQINLFKQNIITEYHLVGLFKAMAEGRPVIIDEANLIRPETLMALNDYFTRKVGQEIELPNGFGKIKIKEGFCIILTGNDPDSYTNADRYKAGRYKFDEATYNRLSIYKKDYYNQIDKKFEENALPNIEDFDDRLIETLNENELYNIILMFLLKDNKNAIELVKKDFVGKTASENKKKLFNDLKNFAIAIRKVQDAFAGKTINITKLNSNVSPGNDINRKVFSMRNLNDVITDFINGNRSLDYYIYREFIKKEPNKTEQYALVAVFHEYGFFEGLVSDDMEQTLENLNLWYLKERKGTKTGIADTEEDKTITEEEIKNKLRISKLDIYKQYFNGLFDLNLEQIPDEELEQVEKELSKNVSQDFEEEDDDKIEYSLEQFKYTIDAVYEMLLKGKNKKIGNENYEELALLLEYLKEIKKKNELDNLENKEKIFAFLIEFLNNCEK